MGVGWVILLAACGGAANSATNAEGGRSEAGAGGLTSVAGGAVGAGAGGAVGAGGNASGGTEISTHPSANVKPLCFDASKATACVETAQGLHWPGVELANAIDLKGAGAHFVDVGGTAALLVSASGEPSVVLASSDGTSAQVLGIDLSAGPPNGPVGCNVD